MINWLRTKLVDALNWDNSRPWINHYDKDHRKLIDTNDLRRLISASRKLTANLGVVKGAIQQKADYAVGQSWQPIFKGKDYEWGEKAERWLKDKFYPMCDVRGPSFDLVKDLYIGCQALDRDGDFGVILSGYDTGFPAIQIIPGHRIMHRHGNKDLEGTSYEGRKYYAGVILNDVGRPLGYHILGESAEEDRIIEASNFIHVFDPESPDQVRGLPSTYHAINTLNSFLVTQDYEEQACMAASAYAIIEHNETGLPDTLGPDLNLYQDENAKNFNKDSTGQTTGSHATTETIGGAVHKFFKAGSGSKLEVLKSDRPGDAWESFQDRLIRVALAGMGWPYEMIWKAEGTGPAIRLQIGKAMRTVEKRQAILRSVAKRIVGYAISKAVKRGDLDSNDEWYKWDFTVPSKLTVDLGRDAANARADYDAGLKSMTDILGEQGKSLEEHLQELKREKDLKEKIIGKEQITNEEDTK